MYSTTYGFQLNATSATILNCNRDYLLLTYLGVPLLGRCPRRQDWLKLILMSRARLTFWKANYLSLRGCLTLLNSILTSIPTYCVSVFQLPIWIIKEIDKVQRDFLWKGPEIGPKGFHLVAWKRICRTQNMGGWGILNLKDFNQALLGKW